ncbi:helix-turn-helix transcriptional regulator [Bradyrhizobium sp. Arg237L]|uniref:helix-turn-helix domain-containing protein n=1 Tax=Bradyrhizobium sp. Arg237L TaxID=3003352 RepID=UPI00249E17AE|nr:helix-turn-helix transcriptional regulator [Bradyrhizobium sp. Arg237L]MDI4239314.1 helix-turn-helix transcriptional regulator [Bradyrhizobium sp. Arg237L]
MPQQQRETRKTVLGTIGSGNVFADLGLPDAETLLLKAKLVSKIDEVIKQRGLTQAEAAKITGLSQQELSALRSGQTDDYSLERLRGLLSKSVN